MPRALQPDALGREATPRGAEVVIEESAKVIASIQQVVYREIVTFVR